MIAPARTAALAALRAIEDGDVDLPSALAHSRTRLHDDRDRALAADIMAGTLRWQAALDHLIAHAAHRPLERLDAEIITILRLSLYQILHLTRVPASAVVDDAVDLVRLAGKSSATGFVNAVLRSVLRQRHRLPLPERPSDLANRDDALAYLGVTLSHPTWLAGRWLDRHGFAAAERWLVFNNETPALTLRANSLRLTRDELAERLRGEDIETTPLRWAPEGLAVLSGNPLQRTNDGIFVVQDEASQLVALTVDAHPGQNVLDLCAAPGGKTTAVAALMEDQGVVIACDVRPRRIRLLREAVAAFGATSVHVVQVPRSGALPFGRRFERVLVDAPCSGLGTVRRDPDIKWRRSAVDVEAFGDSQVQLLSRAAEAVAPGGRLVYATCSSEPEENEHVVDAFLAVRADFEPVPALADPSLTPLLDRRGFFRTLPFAHDLDAFFAAALRRHAS